VDRSPEDAAVASAILSLGKNLGVTVATPVTLGSTG